MKKRYLLTFSYIGTYFKASAKISRDVDTRTVVGALEWAFQTLPSNLGVACVSPLTISSRTDAGVHALGNTAHIDLEHKREDGYIAEKLIFAINKQYKKSKLPLRITDVRHVSDEFNARRFARLRTYLYRIGVAVSDKNKEFSLPIPISEVNHCYFTWNLSFDENAFQEALSLFCGTHDFSSFTGKLKEQLALRTPIRRVISCYACQGKPVLNPVYEPFSENYKYWDVVVEGRSFNYRQVRRMVSAALAVASGGLSIDNLKRMLDLPTQNPLHCRMVPAHGLYLVKVVYNEEDLSVDWKRRSPKLEHLKLLTVLNQYRHSLEN